VLEEGDARDGRVRQRRWYHSPRACSTTSCTSTSCWYVWGCETPTAPFMSILHVFIPDVSIADVSWDVCWHVCWHVLRLVATGFVAFALAAAQEEEKEEGGRAWWRQVLSCPRRSLPVCERGKCDTSCISHAVDAAGSCLLLRHMSVSSTRAHTHTHKADME